MTEKRDRGLLVVVCAPSGSGKTSICNAYMKRNSQARFSTSLTTRPAREGELHGKDYWFVNEEEFIKAVENGDMAEYENVHDWMYGTRQEDINKALNNSEVLLIDIDIHGGQTIKSKYPDDTLTIFIKPSSIDELKKRLRERGTDSNEKIERRLERYEHELSEAENFDVIIKNENLGNAVNQFEKAIENKGG